MSRTPPPIAVVAPGEYITGALWNTQVGGIGSFALTPPVFHGYANTAQSIASGSTVPVTLTTATVDTEGGWSPTSNPNEYTVKTAGKYLAIANGSFVTNGDTTGRGVLLLQNGSNVVATTTPAIASVLGWQAQCSSVLTCAVGDTIQVGVIQVSSGAINTNVGAAYNYPSLTLYWISE